MEPENPLLDEYVLQASGVARPTVCFLPTASGDSNERIAQFYTAFNRWPCRPIHLALFRRPAELAPIIEASDILYVGGGNTRFMLAIWRACGLDRLVRQAWERGTVLAGVSAGAICWFEQGLTDSDGPLTGLDCLGFLPGSCAPHYDGEAERRPSFQRLIGQGALPPGLALDDGAAAHFVDSERRRIVTSRPGAAAYWVSSDQVRITEESLPVEYLGPSRPTP